MGTKANPGKYDCYAAAGDDEPIFVLRAKDLHAAQIVRTWAQMRLAAVAHGQKPDEDMAAIREAHAVADDMDRWRWNATASEEQKAQLTLSPEKPHWNKEATEEEKEAARALLREKYGHAPGDAPAKG